jgi:hypothetical protein
MAFLGMKKLDSDGVLLKAGLATATRDIVQVRGAITVVAVLLTRT